MAIKAESYKNWCVDNISPQSWTRIVLRSLDVIRSEGLTLKELENPEINLSLSPNIVAALNKALEELYETKVEEELLNLY